MEDNRNFGKYIAEKRKEKGLTQEELANKLYVIPTTISKWERGMLLCKWHRNYFSVNTNVYTKFSFKIKKLIM